MTSRIASVVLVLVAVLVCVPAQSAAAGDQSRQKCEPWQLVNPLPTAFDLNGVAFGDGRWAAVGGHGTALTSTDRVRWREVATPMFRHPCW